MLYEVITRRDLITLARSWVALLIAGVAVVLLAILLGLAASSRLAGRYVHNTNWTRFIGIVHVGVARMRADPRDAFEALTAAVVYQLLVIGAVYCAIHTVGASVPNGAIRITSYNVCYTKLLRAPITSNW